jgi:hypothetical protein
MGERPDEVRRNPLNGGARDTDPLADPAGGPEEVRSAVGPDPPSVAALAVARSSTRKRRTVPRSRAPAPRSQGPGPT